MIGGFYVEEVILLDSFQEPFGEGPDRMVRRGRGEGIIWCSDCRGLEVGMRCRVGEGVGRAVFMAFRRFQAVNRASKRAEQS